MKILVLNDTSYHSGCKQVMNVIRSQLAGHEVKFAKKVKASVLEEFDVLIINGEGTMHDDAKKAKLLISLAEVAKQQGLKTLLINSVWQNNSVALTSRLTCFNYISVREINSKHAITDVIDIPVDVNLDLSFYANTTSQKGPPCTVVTGNYSYKSPTSIANPIKVDNFSSSINIFNEDWDSIVTTLRAASVLVTGRHHEMYAACVARCPFVVLEGNTHKNSGLLDTYHLDIPVLPTNASVDEIKQALQGVHKYDKQFRILFDLMHKKDMPNILDIIRDYNASK